MESKRYKLNSTDFKKLGKGCLIAGGGAVLTYLLELLPNVDFGPAYTPVAVALGSILINTLLKVLRGN